LAFAAAFAAGAVCESLSGLALVTSLCLHVLLLLLLLQELYVRLYLG
jgi:hypothetical protein